MKNPIILTIVSLILFAIPGCFHSTDEEILQRSYGVYDTVAARYQELLTAPRDESIVDFARGFGADSRLSSWSLAGWWNNHIGNDYLTETEGAPLHRATYFIDNDIGEINRQLGYLESRMLTGLPIYEKLRNLRGNLNYGLGVMQASGPYMEEARFIESRRLQLQQLEESRTQNRLIQEMAYSKPQVITQTTVVTERVKPKPHSRPISVVKQTVIEQKCAAKPRTVLEITDVDCTRCDNPKKKNKIVIKDTIVKEKAKKKKKNKEEDEEEVIINVDDLKGKKPHLVI